ncbi:hypothetical protein ACWGJ9_11640 [Curtobacterium citreum]
MWWGEKVEPFWFNLLTMGLFGAATAGLGWVQWWSFTSGLWSEPGADDLFGYAFGALVVTAMLTWMSLQAAWTWRKRRTVEERVLAAEAQGSVAADER